MKVETVGSYSSFHLLSMAHLTTSDNCGEMDLTQVS